MKYLSNYPFVKEPEIDFNKATDREILQYCVGGLLYTPATKIDIADKIIGGRLHSIRSLALCLEDSIGDSQVEEAENVLKETLQKFYNNLPIGEVPLIFIRVREPKQISRLLEKCGESLSAITGFLIPKFNPINMGEYMEEFHKVKNELNAPLYIMPIIESRNAICLSERINNLLRIKEFLDYQSDEVLNIRVGGADFSNIYGVRRAPDQNIWQSKVIADALSDIVNIFGTDYVVSGPVWEYFGESSQDQWAYGLDQEVKLDILNGMIGKTCIHPHQIDIVERNLRVTPQEYNDATQIINSSVSKVGVLNGNGKMNELRTHARWAEKIIKRASIYGVMGEQ